MTLLRNIYTELKKLQLVNNAQTFSIRYLAKNKNWYSYQTHMGREFSFSSAINCAFYMRSLLQQDVLNGTQRQSVAAMLREIKRYLAERYMVTWTSTNAEH